MGQKLPNIHCLIDKIMNMFENYLTKTYLKISEASSSRCIGIAGYLRHNRELYPVVLILAKVRWEGGIRVLCMFKVSYKTEILSLPHEIFMKETDDTNFKNVNLRVET